LGGNTVNNIWQGPDNILCLGVRRGIDRSHAHQSLLERADDDLEAAITA
jgi:acyl-CoA dehydrogenase